MLGIFVRHLCNFLDKLVEILFRAARGSELLQELLGDSPFWAGTLADPVEWLPIRLGGHFLCLKIHVQVDAKMSVKWMPKMIRGKMSPKRSLG